MKEFIEVLNNIVVMVAAVVGGFWALWRIKRERTDEAALEMALTHTLEPLDHSHLVVFTVQLSNRGKTKIEAKSERSKEGWTFDDGTEKLKYACSLQIRGVQPSPVVPPQGLDWFEGGPWQDMALYRGGREINVLLEYENPHRGDAVEFWMEPGESYRLGVPVVLPAGTYVAKLTFVGADLEEDSFDRFLHEIGLVKRAIRALDENFWSQIYGFSVPRQSQPS
jgi:hypothetical protein